jgi:RHS repeat-associated protein
VNGWDGAAVVNRTTTLTFDSLGRFANQSRNAYNQLTESVPTNARNAYGSPTQVLNIDNAPTDIAYGDLGQEYFRRDPTGAFAATENALCSQISGCPDSGVYRTRKTVAGGGRADVYFDVLGREVRRASVGFDGTDIYVDTEYDTLGRVARKSEPYYAGQPSYWTEFAYDILGRAIEVRHPDYATTSNATDMAYSGFVTTITNGKQQTRTETRNAAGELVQTVDNYGNSVTYAYDATGNLRTSTQHAADTGVNAVATLLFDKLGRKTSMTDADMGTWTYSYNGFGELIQQNTAISGKYTTVAYDLLGRMTGRIDVSGGVQESNSAWIYDLGTNALGKLTQEDTQISGNPGVTRAFTYGTFGRSSTVTTTISGNNYSASTTYDQFGRVFQAFDGAETYSGLEYYYNAFGHLEAAIESKGSATVTVERYRITGKDARGQVTGMNKGGITVSRVFSPDTGRVDSIFAQTQLGTTIQNFSFDFDVLGSLTAKTDARRGLSETYGYDGLNRLTSVTGSSSLTMNYDGLGNITSKSDVGTYTYTSGGKPHAVTNAGGVGYGYDGNGNLTSGDGRSNSYTVFNKPNSMSQAGNTVSIDYGPNRERFRRIELKSGQTTTTHYVGGFEKIWRPNGVNETKRYLDGEVIVTTRSNGTQDVEYLFTDHLGSTDVITNDAGVIVQSMAFDAFGKRRDPINYAALSQTTIFNFDTTHTTKGFTSHEEMDPVGLVHMNGRVYEPRLGRFLSADTIVQDPSSTQSLNRYSYVFNNPLSNSDPSGHIFWAPIVWAVATYAAGEAARTYNMPWLAAAAQIAGCSYGYCVVASTASTYGATHDFNAALKSGAIAGASEFAFGQIHNSFQTTADGTEIPIAERSAGSLVAQGAAHGVVGGVLAELQGGKFGNGFISAGLGFAAGAGGTLANFDKVSNGVLAIVVGGTTSEITGGQFANGAVTAAMGYLFNDLMQITGGMKDTKNPFGHTALAVEGAGLFSYGNDTPLGSDPLAYITKQAEMRDQLVTIIPTTREQDAAAVEYFSTKPGMNSVGTFDNCSVRTSEALMAAGVPVTGSPFPGGAARQTATLPGVQNFYIPKGGQVPPALNDVIRQRFTPPSAP